MARPAVIRNGAPQTTAPASGDGPSASQVSSARSGDVVAFERAVVEFFTSAAEPLGIPHSVAAIYGVLYASAEPLSFSDIAGRLEISRGSISQGLRALREIGAIVPVPAGTWDAKGRGVSGKGPGEQGTEIDSSPLPLTCSPSRHTAWAPDTEMRKLIERFLESRVQPQLSSGQARLAGLGQLTAGFPSSHQAVLRQRVEKLQAWHDRTRALLPLIRTFLRLGG